MKLVIAEKPSVAKSIASVIGADQKKNGYFEGNGYIVTWCYGHLVGLAYPEEYKDEWKSWEYETLPIIPETWKYVVNKDNKQQFNIIKGLMNDSKVDSCVCATDAGREGEHIFRLVYDKAGCKKPIERLWISSLEEKSIRDGFRDLQPGSKYDDLYKSALCRARADWIVGLNDTRLFTVIYKSSKPLNVGRVQSPTLAMIVEREDQIKNFQTKPFYTVHLRNEDNSIQAVSKRFDEKSEADRIASVCNEYLAVVKSVTKEQKSNAAPKLYDMTTLQRDANRLFGFTAQQTLDATQSLYEAKLVTYPRTDAQFLTDDMADTAEQVFEAVMVCILHEEPFMPNVNKVLDSKKVTDHHAIIPTMEISKADISKLSATELKVLFLIANRMVCALAEPHIYQSVKAVINCQEYEFTVSGKTVINDGWKAYENSFRKANKADKDEEEAEDEKKLPELVEGQSFKAFTKVAEGFTQPPKHFTEDSLLSAMERAGSEDMDDEVERKGLGTTATRAGIIEKLISDGFLKRVKKQMLPTEDGIKLISILPDEVKSPKLTAEWENKLVLVSKGEMSDTEFMKGIVDMVEDTIRKNSVAPSDKKDIFGSSRNDTALGKCPHCGGDILWHKEYGAYCNNKCGMSLGKIMGKQLSQEQVKSLLDGKKFLLKGLVSKAKGTTYDAYIVPDGIEPYSYNGKDGFQYKFSMEFPKKKGGKK